MTSYKKLLTQLTQEITGEVHTDSLSKTIYATDASVYKEEPIGVAYPKTNSDIKTIVRFAATHNISLIPRSGGTSLAGQCVGNGLVVDVSRFMNQIVSLDVAHKTVTVQPGMVRDQLNSLLKEHGLFFAPITSTANRATIGGMVGNNSCGSNSIVYGDTRRYIKELHAVLSDGSEVVFKDLSKEEFDAKLTIDTLEGAIYRHINTLIPHKEQIKKEAPKASIERRNTGYALDQLLGSYPFEASGELFNFSKLIAGSEGTLAFVTDITVGLCPLPPAAEALVICSFATITDCMEAVTSITAHSPYACELMDKVILDCTRENITYRKTMRYFEGDPAGVLLAEFRADMETEALKLANQLIADLKAKEMGTHYSVVTGEETKDIWDVRKAGLGLLANIPGDAKAVACIEDTAVDVADLAAYMAEFDALMKGYNQEMVYYAHAGAGEIHLRPVLNLKTTEDRQKFYDISLASAQLVKKYGGSLSGEHGDGRVRAPFIPLVVGEENYKHFEAIKTTWDANGVFNPHKIVHAKPMNEDLRYEADKETATIDTLFDFSSTEGILRMAEKCNGSGDCRKLPLSGGTMCPSYQATRNERHTTRARANTLRTFLSKDVQPNPFDHEEIKEVLDLCVSCKGCTSECPSNVDMATMKAEFQYQYNKTHGTPLRSKVFAYNNSSNTLGSLAPRVTNFFLKNKTTSGILKKVLDVAPERQLPLLHTISLRSWYRKHYVRNKANKKQVYLFCDEFTNYNDTPIGIKAIQLLDKLGYSVTMVEHPESGRAALSKGLLEKAKKHANENVTIFSELVSTDAPLLGVEPSAILSFRDEYPRLVDASLKDKATRLAANTMLIEEFLAAEIRRFAIDETFFHTEQKQLMVHGHCHQKALSSMNDVFTLLSLPKNYTVKILNTGCCGMAGSFGYEKEHYEVSMRMGELVLFPAVRSKGTDELVVASGTSCRHQIMDGTEEKALHAVEVLFDALV